MIENRAFLYGEVLFVTMRVYNSSILGLKRHQNQMKWQIENYFLKRELTFDEEQFLIKQFASIQVSKPNEIIRMSVYLEKFDGLVFEKINLEDLKFHLSNRDFIERDNIRLKSFQNPFRTGVIPNFKYANYLPSFYLRSELNKDDFDDVLFLDNELVVEASTSNILFEKDGSYFSPKLSNYHGSTIQTLEKVLNIKFCEININDIKQFDFAFLLNCANIIMNIRNIDKHEFQVNNKKAIDIKKYYLASVDK